MAGTSGPACPKRFVNNLDNVVTEALDGLVWSNPNLGRLDAYPAIKVVYRTDWEKASAGVALISGGGAGHEPMHAGFIGQGMLTAAVSGETFASPTIDAVFAGILQVTGPAGCLLIIKNYTGDRLNFTLAAQRARAEPYNLKVEVVFTKDDVATSAQRGVAGTLFVHKIAGAAAAAGKSLEEVKAVAEAVIERTSSLGVAFSSVRRLKPEMIAPGKMEIGLGIHGEPGARTEDVATADKIVEALMEGACAGERVKDPTEGFACLINNLGGVVPMEMCLLTNSLMKSKYAGQIKLLVGPASLCTSLDMNGFSLSLLKLNAELQTYLQAPTGVTTWPAAVVPSFPTPAACVAFPGPFDGVEPSSDEAVMAIVQKVLQTLIDAKEVLDTLDGKVGDADCGSTMAGAASLVLEVKDKLPLASPVATCKCLGMILSKSMGGSSGVLLSIMFMGMSSSFEKAGAGATWQSAGAQAFMDGLQSMMAAGGASPGDRTMLDSLVPAAEALLAGKGLAGAKAAAAAGVEATKNMVPRMGRSENVPESAYKEVEDPGARAASFVFDAMAS